MLFDFLPEKSVHWDAKVLSISPCGETFASEVTEEEFYLVVGADAGTSITNR
jgi:hypothetical protein